MTHAARMRTLSKMDVATRASDGDRQRVIAELQRHTAAGRLSLDEFSERAGHVYAARTLGELLAVTRDLPVETAALAGGHRRRRDLLVVFAVAALTLVLLKVFMAVIH